MMNRGRVARAELCRTETAGFAHKFVSGLNTAFMAQVLGQDPLTLAPQARDCVRAYTTTHARAGQRLERLA
jgi:hypothetical protein